MEQKRWESIIIENKGKCIGSLLGLIIALAVLFLGLWRTLFIAICVSIGYYFGNRRENRLRFYQFLMDLMPEGKEKE